METAFEDTFGSFNVSRWLPSGSINAPAGATPNVGGKYLSPWGYAAYGAAQDQCAPHHPGAEAKLLPPVVGFRFRV